MNNTTHPLEANPDASLAITGKIADPILGIAMSAEPDWLEPQTIDPSFNEWPEPDWDLVTGELGECPEFNFSPDVVAINEEIERDARAEEAERYQNYLQAYSFETVFQANLAYKRFMACLPDAAAWTAEPIQFTMLTSKNGQLISKHFYLEENLLKKKTNVALAAGTYKTIYVNSMLEFCEVLNTCRVDQALMYGVSKHATTGLLTTKKMLPVHDDEDVAARSKDFFSYPSGPAIVAIDYDPPKNAPPFTASELLQKLCQAFPALQDTAVALSHSSSCFIYVKKTGEELKGSGGMRVCFAVKEGNDIPRVMEVLNCKLWLIQCGRIEISSSGAKLKRTLVDLALANPVQPDFAGGASCDSSLEQRRPEAILLWDGPPLDSKKFVPNLNKEQLRANDAIQKIASDAAEPTALKTRAAWLEQREKTVIEQVLKRRKSSPNNLAAYQSAETLATEVLHEALHSSVLKGDFLIKMASGESLSVSHLIKNIDKYDECLTLDPIEPDYDGGRVVGKLYLSGKKPVLVTMAHGGSIYELVIDKPEVYCRYKNHYEAINETIEILRKDPHIFDSGTNLVEVLPDGRLEMMKKACLSQYLNGIAVYFDYKDDAEGNSYKSPFGVPQDVPQTVLEMEKSRNLKKLTAVVTAPMMLPDGRMLSTQGFDSETGLYLKAMADDEWDLIIEDPSVADMQKAFSEVFYFFKEFPWATPLDKSVAIAAIFTAIVRRGLTIAPSFAFDAPTQSSGKTKAALAAASLVTGRVPGITGYAFCRSEEEMSKLLLTQAVHGTPAFIIDNVIGRFESSGFAGVMTSGFVTGRMLGTNTLSGDVPYRAFTALSGNNMVFGPDSAQRILVARIDPKTDSPHTRTFDFDPIEYAVKNRSKIICAGLTILKGFVNAGMPKVDKRTSRFHEWDRLVRQGLLWMYQQIELDLPDPLDALELYREQDPDFEMLTDLLVGWKDIFGMETLLTKDVLDWFDDHVFDYRDLSQSHRAFFDVLSNSVLRGTRPTQRSIGNLLSKRVDQISGGLRLVRSGKAHNGLQKWRLDLIE